MLLTYGIVAIAYYLLITWFTS